MAKRFTETDKWKDKWFRSLRPEHKLAYLYILDNCDHAGVIDIDEQLADFQIGVSVEWQDFFMECGDRVARLANGKIFLCKFIEYQYGKLSPDCRPHLPVLQKLRDHGIDAGEVRQKEVFKHGNVNEKRRMEIIQRDGNVCCYCGGQFEAKMLQPDHVIPKSKGGTDSKDNLVAACVSCNAKKSDKDFSYFVSTLDNPSEAWKRVRQRVSERVFNTLKEKDKEQEQDTYKDKDKDKEKDKEKEGVQGEEKVPAEVDSKQVEKSSAEFRSVWTKWKQHLKTKLILLNEFEEEMALMHLRRSFPSEADQIAAIEFSILRKARNLITNGDHKRQREGPSHNGKPKMSREELYSKIKD